VRAFASSPKAPTDKAGRHLSLQDAGALFAVYIVLFVVLATTADNFLTVRNVLNILMAVSTIGTISVAMTMVIVAGGIDLSVGSVVAISGVAVAQLSHVMPMPLAVLCALATGLVVGAANGLAVTRLRINPLIASLGTLSIARGLAFVWSKGQTQTIEETPWFVFLGRGHVGPVPFQVIVMAALFILTAWVMRKTVFGRNIYAIGGNLNAAVLAGLPVRRTTMWLYVLSGLSAAVAGVFLASQLGAGAPNAVTGVELSVIAAVILGGTSLSGGKGAIAGTLLGVLILGTLNNGLTLLQVNSYYQEVARGAVLMAAVAIDQLRVRDET
jgi:ribose transport system permease protein